MLKNFPVRLYCCQCAKPGALFNLGVKKLKNASLEMKVLKGKGSHADWRI
jgi:hypothetical protein